MIGKIAELGSRDIWCELRGNFHDSDVCSSPAFLSDDTLPRPIYRDMDEYHGPDSSGSPENQARGPEIGHACNSCRRRKLRCSRELPACQHCRKTVSECHYETKRAKPGMKAGALDNIHRRLGGSLPCILVPLSCPY